MCPSSTPGTGRRLSSQGLLVGGEARQPRLAGNVVLGLEDRRRRRKGVDGGLAAAQADEAAHAAALALEGRVGAPADGAGVLGGPGRGAGAGGHGLVVEAGEGLELGVGEQPELQHVGGEVGVDGARGQLHERAQRQGHLAQLVREGRVARQQRARLDGVGGAARPRRRGVAACAAALLPAEVDGRRGGGRGRRGGCGR